MARAQVYSAIDRADLDVADALIAQVAPEVDGLKLGLEFFLSNGREGARRIARAGRPIFFDLKLKDIPNTVAAAVTAVTPLDPRFLTVHASGGRAMLEAAVGAARDAGSGVNLLGVTVLTSLDEADLDSIGVHRSAADQVRALAELALEAGCHGLVCSAAEVTMLRRTFGPQPTLVVPGIRPAGAPTGDQKRTLTPREAQEAGADVLVVGRPITDADDPAAAAAAIVAELGGDAG